MKNISVLSCLIAFFLFSNLNAQTVFGVIADENDEVTSKVNVKFEIFEGDVLVDEFDVPVNDAGGYFSSIPTAVPAHNVRVTPEKDIEFLNGVSTFDLVLIRKHILSVKKLDSPYKIIAADINNDQVVTVSDLIDLQTLILNAGFPNNSSYRFVKEDYVFPNPQNPWEEPFPESCYFEGVDGNVFQNFIFVKIGDVN